MSDSRARPPDHDVRVAWARSGALRRGAFAAVSVLVTRIVLSAMGGATAATLALLFVPRSGEVFAIVLVLATLPVLIAAVPLRHRPLRAAFEFVFDYKRRADALWRATFGEKPPEDRASTRRWLDARPHGPRPVAMLILIGRLDEVDQELSELDADPTAVMTPAESYRLAVFRQQWRLVEGQPPELDALRDGWRDLPSADRGLAREVLGILEALAAASEGGDPVAALASARRDVTDVHWSARAAVVVARWVAIAVVPVAIAIGVRLFVLPRAMVFGW